MVYPVTATILLFLQMAFGYSQQLPPVTCPPGFIPANTSRPGSGEPERACSCGEVWKRFNTSKTVRCKDTGFEVFTGHCLTYSVSVNSLSVGACPYNTARETVVITIRHNISELGDTFCAPFHRKGRLCEECMEGFSPSIAHSMHCKQCNVKFAWLKYVAMQVVIPSSALFVIIVVCNVQFSSSPLNALVLFFQTFYACLYYDAKLNSLIGRDGSVFVHILMAVYRIFNLDFYYIFSFNNFSQICFGQSMKGVHILLMKYFEAFSPLVLVLVVSLCAYLHSKNCRPLVFAWNGILKIGSATCFKIPAKNSSSQRLCNAFIVLAYSKILFVSLNFLIPNKTSDINGTAITQHWKLYFDPTVKYFGREHIPYAILAISVLCLFVVFPLLILILYLFRPFGTLYSRVLRSRWHIMNYFIDAFQGWYRNGTDNTSFDYRLVFSVFPVIKILCALWMSVFTGMEYRGSRIWLLPSMVLQGTGLFFAIFRPYRIESMNKLDSIILWLLGTIAFTQINTGEGLMHFTVALAYFPILGVATYAIYKFCYRIKRLAMTKKNCCCSCLLDRRAYPSLLHNDLLESRELEDGSERLDYGAASY